MPHFTDAKLITQLKKTMSNQVPTLHRVVAYHGPLHSRLSLMRLAIRAAQAPNLLLFGTRIIFNNNVTSYDGGAKAGRRERNGRGREEEKLRSGGRWTRSDGIVGSRKGFHREDEIEECTNAVEPTTTRAG